MSVFSVTRGLIVALAFGGLVACDSAEDRAEEHYQNSLELLAAGDTDRALVELRNALKFDEFHREARALYARTVRDRGNIPEAYANFLRLAEEDPEDTTSRLALTEMAIRSQNWEEAERHVEALRNASAQVPGSEVVDVIMRFREAILAKDPVAEEAALDEAATLAERYPNDTALLRALVEGKMRRDDVLGAIGYMDKGIAAEPDNPLFYQMKAAALLQRQDVVALEDHLRVMIARFPEDDQFKQMLVRLLAGTGQAERAEDFLREQIAAGDTKLQVALIAFLRQSKGAEAALAELETMIAASEDKDLLRALRAGIRFDLGGRDEAVAELQDIIQGAEPSDRTNGFKIALARMLETAGNDVGARTLVEEVLADDPGNIEGLKMSAGWLIDSDQTDDAINALRRALDQAPRDAQAMTLMARAHQRAGDMELAEDLLALAAEASGYAPAESLRFARLLAGDNRLRPAEDVLVNGLRANPGNVDMLKLLGEVYLRSEDWARAGQVEASLRRLGTDEATQAADTLRLQILTQRDGREQALAALEQMASDGTLAARLSLLRERVREGDDVEALGLAEELVSETPEDPRIRLVLGNTQLALRDFDAAEATYRGITEASPEFEQGWMQLTRALSAQGRTEDARRVVDEALAANPGSPNLLWSKAGFLERANDIDGAIAIYEDLYDRLSNSPIVANNLASLLATYRNDEASLDRAFTIARRLRGTEQPAFQDTYGWILHRRGQHEEALSYLRPAAERLTRDPIVQFHLAETLAALGQTDEALERYRAAVEIAGADDPREQIARAQSEIERLSAAEAPK